MGEGGSKSQREARVKGEGDRAGEIWDRTAKAIGQSQKEWHRAVVMGVVGREQGQDHGEKREPGMASMARRHRVSFRGLGQGRRQTERRVE